jgi:hypothetical protein
MTNHLNLNIIIRNLKIKNKLYITENNINNIKKNNDNIKIKIIKNINYKIQKKNNKKKINYKKIILLIQILPNIDEQISIECILKNLNSRYILKVYGFGKDLNINHPNYIFHKTNSLSFKSAISLANLEFKEQIVGICNSDIFIDESCVYWIHLENELNNNKIYCLSSSEYLNDTKIWKEKQLENVLYSVKQDFWIFKSPLNIKNIENLNYDIDNHGASNAFAYELYKNNYIPINNQNKFRILHYHNKYYKKNNYPEKSGQLLLPDTNMIKNIDLNTFSTKINLTNDQIYLVKCFMISQALKISK